MLRPVSLGELERCACMKGFQFGIVLDEEYPRCSQCAKPIDGRVFIVWKLMQSLRATEQIRAGVAEHEASERDLGVATEHTIASHAIEDAGGATEHPTSEDGHVSTVSATTSQLESLIEDGQICEMDLF